MALKPLTAAQKKVISSFARAVVVSEISKDIKGFEGFKEHYLKNVDPEAAQAVRAFDKAVRQARADFAKQLREEGS